MRGLVDTSTFILMPNLDPSFLPDEPVISAITLAELSAGPLLAASDVERERRQAHVQLAESSFEALPFDPVAARAFGAVAASLRRAGRKIEARAYDALIAAIALGNGIPLYTCNPEDFAGIDDLELIAIPHPDQEAGE
jgi:tRNA(fMet)-specific endonuclease VapC